MSTVQEIEEAILALGTDEQRALWESLASKISPLPASQDLVASSKKSPPGKWGLGYPGVDAGTVVRSFSRADLMDEMLDAP